MIKYLLLSVAVVVLLTGYPKPIIADQLSPIQTNKEIVESLVTKYAAQYDVSAYRMNVVLACEDSTYEFDRQSDYVALSGREKSFGVAQINLPSHADITYAEATDPNFAVEFMAKEFSLGHAYEWSCYRSKFQ